MAHPAPAVPAPLLLPVVLDIGGVGISIPALVIAIPLAPFSFAVATPQAVLRVIPAFVTVVVSPAASLAVSRGANRLVWAEARGTKRLSAYTALAGCGGHLGLRDWIEQSILCPEQPVRQRSGQGGSIYRN